MTLVTVVIPARNEEADLAQAIRHVGLQDWPLDHLEVVVVDGDSTDLTAEVARNALRDVGLARWGVVDNPGGNTPSNLNRGLHWADGDVVVRVDARSTIPSDYISRTVAVLSERPDVAVVGGRQVARSRSDRLRDVAIAEALNNPVLMGGSRYRRTGARSGSTDTVYLGVFRRKDLLDVGGWDERLSTNQDFDLNRRLASHGLIWFEQGIDVGYVPRRSIVELASQYHRFGRWKAHYWRTSGRRPERRQVALVVVPPILASCAVALAVRMPLRLRTGIVAFAAGAASEEGFRRRAASLAINGLIGTSWWTGVVRGAVRDRVG